MVAAIDEQLPGPLAGRWQPRGAHVRYIHTILHSALAAAVDDDLIAVNPVAKAKPPTAKEARSPEMQTWDADQLRTFLDCADTAARGRRPGGRPHLRRLTAARYHRSITGQGRRVPGRLPQPLTCSNVMETTCGRGESNPHARRHQILSLAWLPLHHSRAVPESRE
jgi:hypothetical protein